MAEQEEAPAREMPPSLAASAALLKNEDLRLRVCRHGMMLYSLNDLVIGRSLDMYGEYNEGEVTLYKNFARPGDVVLDIGANIGAFTLFFARAVQPGGLVVAYEPQRILFQVLCANLAINRLHNVEARRAALGESPGRMRLPRLDYGREDNFGNVILKDEEAEAGEPVGVETIDAMELARCSLIKIDVEGMERQVLLGGGDTIERHRPVIYLENNIREKSPALIQILFDLGYRVYWHFPWLYNQKNYRGQEINIFEKTININLLCMPQEDQRSVELTPVESVDDWWQDAPTSDH